MPYMAALRSVSLAFFCYAGAVWCCMGLQTIARGRRCFGM